MSTALSFPRRLVLSAVAAATLAGAGYAAWSGWAVKWRPDPTIWPLQGVAIGAENVPTSWPGLAQANIQFAYIDATRGARVANSRFTADHDAANVVGIRTGAIHHYALCAQVGDQAASFVRLVPREGAALPPLIMLSLDPNCRRQPTRALLLTELSTFLTQVETHMGKAAIIAPSAEFEAIYETSGAINRPLMIHSVRSEPAEDGPDWVLWLANDRAIVSGSTGPTRWLVLHDANARPDAGERE